MLKTICECELQNGAWITAECEHGRVWVQGENGLIEYHEDFPKIVCLCGSTRFSDAYRQANLQETLAGKIVLTIGCDMRADAELFADKSQKELDSIKEALDHLHFRKIDLADEILVLNVDGYIGKSTRREIDYAVATGKRVRFLEPGNF